MEESSQSDRATRLPIRTTIANQPRSRLTNVEPHDQKAHAWSGLDHIAGRPPRRWDDVEGILSESTLTWSPSSLMYKPAAGGSLRKLAGSLEPPDFKHGESSVPETTSRASWQEITPGQRRPVALDALLRRPGLIERAPGTRWYPEWEISPGLAANWLLETYLTPRTPSGPDLVEDILGRKITLDRSR